jgi:uncharacterized integral membrane protein
LLLCAEVHDGIYGPWTIDDTDVAEVILYRGGITVTALSSIIEYYWCLKLEAFPSTFVLNAVCGTGAVGFGLSLAIIHIYITEIKRAIQV